MSIKIENVDIHGWEAAIRGARNPMNSWEKSDSKFIDNETKEYFYYHTLLYSMGLDYDDWGTIDVSSKECKGLDIIGPNDYKLLMNLCKGGSEESKWRRFVHVSMDIMAPLYWWKEFETYKVGTSCNSCSTMHKIQAKEFTLEDFSCEHLLECDFLNDNGNGDADCWIYPFTDCVDGDGTMEEYPLDILKATIKMLNKARDLFLETKDKRYWYQMIQLLPSSYNQRRTIDLNYEVLAAQYRQRKDHKLDAWHRYCDWIKTLPYSEFITMEEQMLTENICCNCHWYEGVKAVHGTAPCSKHNKQVLWNEGCDKIWLIPERLKVGKKDTMEEIDSGICAIQFA